MAGHQALLQLFCLLFCQESCSIVPALFCHSSHWLYSATALFIAYIRHQAAILSGVYSATAILPQLFCLQPFCHSSILSGYSVRLYSVRGLYSVCVCVCGGGGGGGGLYLYSVRLYSILSSMGSSQLEG
jgi:hypothetical protein